jgi:hypothetical protein
MEKNSEAKLLEELEKLHVKVDRLESRIENSENHKAGPLTTVGLFYGLCSFLRDSCFDRFFYELKNKRKEEKELGTKLINHNLKTNNFSFGFLYQGI